MASSAASDVTPGGSTPVASATLARSSTWATVLPASGPLASFRFLNPQVVHPATPGFRQPWSDHLMLSDSASTLPARTPAGVVLGFKYTPGVPVLPGVPCSVPA